MNNPPETSREKASYRCPVCGNTLPFQPALPRFDAPCTECGAYLWCRQRASDEELILDAMPGRTPEIWDVERLVEALVQSGRIARVIFNMSALDFVSSSLVARLVALNRRIQAAGGKLILCGMHPVVLEIFERVRLDRAFHIVESEEDAVASS
jgi:anti-sigma B factor antagonist